MKLVKFIVYPLLIILLLPTIIFSQHLMQAATPLQVVIHHRKDKIPIGVRVTDKKGNPVENIKINFWLELAPMEATCSISSDEAVTDKKGIATVYFNSGSIEGTYKIGAENNNLINSPLFFTIVLEKERKERISNEAIDFLEELPPLPLSPPPFNRGNISVKEKEILPKKEVEVKPAEPVHIKLYKGKEHLIANGKDKTKITAIVLDRFNNKVEDGTIVKLFTTAGEFISPTERKKEIELATKDGKVQTELLSSTKASKVTITAKVKNIENKLLINFLPDKLNYITLQPGYMEVEAGKEVSLIVRGFDKFHNLVDIKEVKFKVEGEKGHELINNKFISKKSGEYKIIAEVDNLQTTGTIRVTPGPLDKITFLSKKDKIKVIQSTLLIAIVEDIYNNRIKDVKVDFNIIEGKGFLSKTEAITDAYGKAYTTLTTTEKVQNYIIGVTVRNVGRSAQLKIKTLPDTPYSMELKTSRLILIANGKDTTEIEASVKDRYGNIIEEGNVTFRAQKGKIITVDLNDKLEGMQTQIKNGAAKVTYQSPTEVGKDYVMAQFEDVTNMIELRLSKGIEVLEEDKNKDKEGLQVISRNVTQKEKLSLVAGPPTRIEIIPSAITISAGSSLKFKVKTYDAYDNEVETKPIFYASYRGIIDKTTGKYKSEKAGMAKVIAQVNDLRAEATITIVPAEPTKIVINPVGKLQEGRMSKVEAIVYDDYENPVPNIELYFTVRSGDKIIKEDKGITDKEGKCLFEFVLNEIGGVDIEIKSPAIKEKSEGTSKGKEIR